MKPIRILALLPLLLLAAGIARAQEGYRLQPLLRLGDRVGGLPIRSPGYFHVGALNDAGHLLVVARSGNGEALLQLGEGAPIALVTPGGEAPGGKWSPSVRPRSPASLNQAGNAVFAAEVAAGRVGEPGTYRWDRETRRITPVAVRGMPALQSQPIELAGGPTPVINNRDEIALVASIRNAAGRLAEGVFLAGRDGALLPVALPGGPLPDGAIERALAPSLNDTGQIAFLAYKQWARSRSPSAYLWEAGALRLLLAPGMAAPEGAPFSHVESVRLNDPHPGALVVAHASHDHAHHDPRAPLPPMSLYHWVDGAFIPIARIGQEMPGGGRLVGIEPRGVSPMNARGEVAFLALLPNRATGLYLRRADGTLTLLLKTGQTTAAGRVDGVGRGSGASTGVALNNRGQIAVTLKIGRAPDTLYLLTPE